MKDIMPINKPLALALGYFDCVHFAHREIITETVSFARKNKIHSAVFTFSSELYSKGSLPIYSFADRKKLLNELDLDYIIPYRFDDNIKNMTKEAFLQMLFSTFDIKHISCGSDYRFGKDGEGDIDFLKEFVESRGASIHIFSPISIGEEIVSTTLIKDELSKGNIVKANMLLCRPYFIEGRVTRGKSRGAALGYPTANIKHVDRFLPCFGVYKSRTTIGGSVYHSITSVGNKPTFNDDAITVETFIDGNVFNLYAKNIKVELLEFIRPLMRFDSAAELKTQIKKDLQEI